MVENAAPSASVTQSVGDGQAGDSRVRREIIEHAVGGVAVDGQTRSAGAADGHIVGDLKFGAGQSNGARDAGSVNCITIISNAERLAQ